MKKASVILALIVVLGLLAGCGAQPSSADYKQVIESARDAELNRVMPVVTQNDTGDDMQGPRELVFNEGTGFSPDVMERYAISLGFSITQAYGVVIILPAEGQQQAVIDMVNAYVLSQQKAQENYLPDQYEIAMNAIVKTTKGGEVLLAMCEDAEAVMAAIEAGL